MLCRVEMPTNEQIFGRFYRYRLLHNSAENGGGRSIIGLSLIIIVIAIFGIMSGIVLWFGLVIIALMIALLGYTFFMKPNTLFKEKSGAALKTEVYLFSETGFTCSVRSEEGGLPENTSCRYDALKQVIETKQDFYLIMGAKEAYCFDKEYFTNGTPEELRECLKKAVGNKYVGKMK